jgi:antitoxin component YwqK of YwqJK toxin-antitoxin module
MKLISILLFFSINTAFAQSYYKGLVPNTYKVNIVYSDHTVIAHIMPVNGGVFPEAERYYFWYSANKINSTQGGFSGALLNGPYSDYYLNKNLKEKGEFDEGLKNGEWNSWYENGNLKERIGWRLGERNGPFFKYNNSGKLTESGRYRADMLNGKFIRYGEGDSVQAVYYKNGKIYTPKKPFAKFWKSLGLNRNSKGTGKGQNQEQKQ